MAWPKGKPRPPHSGRVKGTPNKITQDLKAMIEGALEDLGGKEYLILQGRENPAAFMALAGKILPKDMKHELVGKLTVTLDGKGPVTGT